MDDQTNNLPANLRSTAKNPRLFSNHFLRGRLTGAADEIERARDGWRTAFNIAVSEQEQNKKLRAAMQEACDLLAERTHGNTARSAGHNARLRLEAALNAGNEKS